MLVCAIRFQSSMKLIKELLLLLRCLLLLLHYNRWQDGFNLHFIVERGSKVIDWALVSGTC